MGASTESDQSEINDFQKRQFSRPARTLGGVAVASREQASVSGKRDILGHVHRIDLPARLMFSLARVGLPDTANRGNLMVVDWTADSLRTACMLWELQRELGITELKAHENMAITLVLARIFHTPT